MEKLSLLVIIIPIGILLLLVIIDFIQSLHGFNKELTYIKYEINRSTGDDRIHWQHQKKRLFLSLIPFYAPRRSERHDDNHII